MTDQPRIFEIRVYVTPENPECPDIQPSSLAFTTAEVVHGQGVGFGPTLKYPLPETTVPDGFRKTLVDGLTTLTYRLAFWMETPGP